MSDTGQFQSSHAFTRINTSDIESVNPNTGSLNVRIPLIKLAGVRPSIDLNVTVFYAPSSQGIFGLPTNWSLDIPYVLDGKSVTTSGRTYAIDFDWADAKNHKSGLRYVNNHGITFKRQFPPKPLPSGRSGTYAWSLQHPDGSLDYFDELGRPAERHDIYNNYIAYDYHPPSQGGSDLRTTRLKAIRDSWGQLVEFSYKPNAEIRVTFPDSGQSFINFSQGGIGSFVDAENLKTKFEYTSIGQGTWQLYKITYPNGLVSNYSFIPIPYYTLNNSKGSFPAVQEHYQRDSNGKLQAHTRYKYGPSDNCTFTGAAINMRIGGAKDSLMDAGITYKYEVQKSSHDDKGTELSRSSTWFNTLHLPIRVSRFSREGAERFKEAQVIKMEYPTSSDHRARSAAYDVPISTESFYSTGGSGDSQLVPLQRSKSENNEFCLPLSTHVELYGSGSSQGYTKQTTVSTEYKKTRVGTMIPTKTTQKDEVSQFVQISENTLTADEKDVASTSTSFSEGSGGSKPFKQKLLEYDANGRVTTETVSWMAGAQVPEGSAKSSTTKTKYQYNAGKLTVTKSDPLGNATTSEHDVRKADGPVIRTILPLGETETTEYDKLGRQTSQTDALGHKTTTAHTVGPNGTSVQTTSPLGFSHTTTTDVLDREIQTSDNGDGTGSQPAARVLSASVYDYQSRLVEKVDGLGLRTKNKYDDLDRPTEITDSNDNVVKYSYQKGGLEVEQTLNGDKRSLIHMDGRSKPITTTRYSDSAAAATEHTLKEEHKYDGRGNIIAKAWLQLDKAGNGQAQALKEEATDFGVDNVVTSQTNTGHTSAGSDKVQRRFTHDLFGNVYTYVKETWYADGKHLTHPGPVDIYDVANRLAISRNQEKQEERREYDQNSRLSQLIRLDGSKVQYTYDSAGRLKTTKYPVSGTSERSYDADGRQVSISQGNQSVVYSYSLDGVEIGVKYPDGKSQTRTLDKHSRTIKEKDVNGNTTETSFHDLGQIARRSCEGDTVEYSYGTTNHTKMQLLSTQQNGPGSQKTTYSYDGHGHVRQTLVKDTRTNKVLMDTTQMHDSLGRVYKTVTASDVVPEVRGERVMEYDGVGQLVKDTRSGESGPSSPEVTTYRYDGNSNVVEVSINNGKTSTMSFNSIDQRTDSGFKYDTNGRLVQDNEGNEYKFDDRDRLISVTQKKKTNQGHTAVAADQVSTYSYAPDDYLSGYKDDAQSVGMYFDAGVANAMNLTPSGSSSVEGGGEVGGEVKEEEDASIFSDSSSGNPLCTITKKKSGGGKAETRYLLNQLGSSVAISPASSSEGKPSFVAKSYDAYGAPRRVSDSTSSPSSNAGGASALFGFTSEFTSPTTSIVYLRARHYNPHLRSFLSMDPRRSLSTPASSSPGGDDHHGSGSTTRVTENRYAYCGGDPVNRIDPTGRSWSWLNDHPLLTLAIGVAVAIAVAALGGIVVEAAVGALAALLPATVPAALVTFGSSFIVGAVSGAMGGLASSIATGDLDSYSWGTAGLDALGGGVGSMTATFVQPRFRTLFNSKGMQRVIKAGKLQNFLKWGSRKSVGGLVGLGTKKGIPAAEKGIGSIGLGVVIGLEVATVWADQVATTDQKGNGSKVAYRGGNTKYEKCGLGYGG